MPKTPPPRPKLTPPKPPTQTVPTVPTKNFKVEPWTGAGEGEKIVGYGTTGLGKTTLFAMMPNPIFVGLDDGGRKIVNPKTQEPINHIPGIETLEDTRAVLQQLSLWSKGSSCIIDTFTMLEQIIERYVLETVPLPKGGRAQNIKAYGWNDGSSHILDTVRLVLQDLDVLVRRGVNVGLICQEQAVKIANSEGIDYLRTGPRLHHDNRYSVMFQVCEWADHVIRLNYLNTMIRAEKDRPVGKVASSDATRAIYISGAQDFLAKNKIRGNVSEDGEPIQCIAFADPADDSLWEFMFDTGE